MPTVAWAAVIASIGLAVALAALAAFATSVTAQSTERIDAQRASIRALEEELIRIDAEAGSAADAVAQARARGVALTRSIRENTAALGRARTAHAEAQERLAARLRALYTEQPPSFVELLVSSDSISGAVDAQDTLDKVREQDAQLVEGIEDAQARLAAARADLKAARAAARREAERAAGKLAELERLGAARRAVLGQARATLQALVVEESARRARLAALAEAERRAQASLAARAAAPAPAAGAPVEATVAAPSTGAPPPQDVLDRIAQCESGGNPRAVSPGGDYRGKYQFHPDTWAAIGGSGDPAAAPEAEQDARAAALYAQRGASPWPICGA